MGDAGEGKQEGKGGTWLFDGKGGSRRYWKWRKWAQGQLLKDGTGANPKFDRLNWGVTVYGWLRGAAVDILEDVSLDDLHVENGHRLIFDILDARFPDKSSQDKLKDTLKDVLRPV